MKDEGERGVSMTLGFLPLSHSLVDLFLGFVSLTRSLSKAHKCLCASTALNHALSAFTLIC